MAQDCLDEATVVAFLDGGLAAPDKAVVASHLEACKACVELVTWAAADHAHRSRSAGHEGRPFVGRLEPGSRVDRYQILGAVGRGGMGEVYAAYHPDLDRRIALKVVNESGGDSTVRRGRLLREARAIARLSHPNVVSVYDAGTVGDRVYIAMEFVEGETADEWLRSKPRGWAEVLEAFIAAGRGLAAAHAAGLIHRDFKPHNVMIGRDGAVRVMDFGLARLAEEPPEGADGGGADGGGADGGGADSGGAADERPLPATVTRTGALVGTLAYMSPEQFRRDKLDVRADQFSFCVALHEALYGSRPALAHLPSTPGSGTAERMRTTNAPVWLRRIVARGLANRREDRFASMDDLIRALAKGRTQPRRRAIGATVGMVVVLFGVSAWQVARGGHVSCSVPAGKLEAAWSGHDDARRQSIHRAFAASGLPTAQATWQRFSRVLDDHVGQWSAMYTETCEATHLRREQSVEVLSLRMICLAENLDEVRALNDALLHPDRTAVSRSVMAAEGLTSVSRCADLAGLRSAVPLPRNAETLARVLSLRSSLRNVRSLVDLGNLQAAADAAAELQPQVEALGYKPLLGELLELVGLGQCHSNPALAEPTLEKAFLTAESSGDDLTAAKVATHLTFAVGYKLARPAEGMRWARIGDALLERIGGGHDRLRAWFLTNQASVLSVSGDLAGASVLFEQSIALKERALGPEHPDLAIGLSNLALARLEAGDLAGALEATDRASAIHAKSGFADAYVLAHHHGNRGDILVAMGRYREANDEFTAVMNLLAGDPSPSAENLSQAQNGLGEVQLAQGRADAALPFLERALSLRERHEVEMSWTADTRFALARALWASGTDRRRARALALAAKEGYASGHYAQKEDAVEDWLAAHRSAHQ